MLQVGNRAQVSGGSWFVELLVERDSRGTFIEFFATSRFTNERWVRIYTDGSEVALGFGADLGVNASEGFYEGLRRRGLLHH